MTSICVVYISLCYFIVETDRYFGVLVDSSLYQIHRDYVETSEFYWNLFNKVFHVLQILTLLYNFCSNINMY